MVFSIGTKNFGLESTPFGRWFVEGTLNASYNALDIHQRRKSSKNLPYYGKVKMETVATLTYGRPH